MMQPNYVHSRQHPPLVRNSPFTLVLLRHGECEHNLSSQYAGHSDSPLTDRGIQQARNAAHKLEREIPNIRSFSFVSSPLDRAITTTKLLLSELSLDITTYRVDARLKELDFGQNTYRTKTDVQSSMPSEEGAVWNTPHPGGESLAQLFSRTGQFLAGLGTDTVVICHSGSARMLRAHMMGLSGTDTLRFRLGNGEALIFAAD